ncbi:hypothetical protein SAMN05192541_15124 [Bradyrhizobium arachidis]|uniref:Uncharacterized protein n=1 Tax=Bradyrhizobium arachidis TaxID=858423 RepID=A0AAE7NRB1_9BRAD|nr:hypothetical protein WN72_23145 [Bradyrhizobium arachidis]SFV19443.1 hypothetical protein SAMN05192541_15124 [Bradyrhizobium arachidis]
MTCARCDGTHWVCENHPERPWEGPKACGCGGAGAPCPVCNRVGPDEMPLLPDGFETSFTTTDAIRPFLRKPTKH